MDGCLRLDRGSGDGCYMRRLMRDERAATGIPSIDLGIYPDAHVEEAEDVH